MIYVGTSGYSFRSWRGVFYPRRLPAGEALRYYCRHFGALELNTSFYNDRPAAAAGRLAAGTPPGHAVAVKLHHSFTHTARPQQTVGSRPASPHHQAPAREVSLGQFLECLAPLRAAGKLAAVLAQFPQSFVNSEPHRAHLAALAEQLAADGLVVEFRHRSWATDSVLDWLRSLGVSYCCVDEPHLPELMPPLVAVTGPIGYVRLHGRNAATWYRAGERQDRYDYLYTEEELGYWVEAVRRMHAEVERVFLFTNNCYTGKAVINARMFQKLLQLGDNR